MAAFIEELWNSVFTPGPTPTLLIATNASFAALQLVLLVLLILTHSIHFIVLSFLCGGLWYSINWFAHELQAEEVKKQTGLRKQRAKSPEGGSDTETEKETPVTEQTPPPALPKDASTLLQPTIPGTSDLLRRRRSLGENSGYVSTDSEWEKVSEGDE